MSRGGRWSGADYAAVEAAREQTRPGRRAMAHALRSRAPGAPTDNRLEQSRHVNGVAHVAIKVLGDQAAACEAHAYKLKPGAKDGGDQDARDPLPYDHPLNKILRRPNGKETGGMLRRRAVQQICLTGTALTWCLSLTNGLPGELWTIPTGTAQPVPPSPVHPEGAYRVTPYMAYGPFATTPSLLGAGGCVIPSEEVLRVDLPHPLVQYDALSPLTACALQLDALESVDKSRWYGMKQSMRPSAAFEVNQDANFPDDAEMARMKAAISGEYSGEHNVGRAVVLSAGLKLVPWSGDHSGMGWETSWGQLADFVLSVFGTTKTLAFMSEASSYAALYAALQQFNLFSLCPLLNLLADAANVQMVWPRFGDDHFIEYVPRKINDEDMEERRLTLDTGIGLRTINEIRTKRGLPTVPWGDTRAFPGNVQQADRGNLADTDAGNDLIDNGPSGGAGGKTPRKESAEQADARPANRQGGGSLPGRMAGLNGHANGKG